MKQPLAPAVLHWSARSEAHGDCAIAALSLACGASYEEAVAACVTAVPKALDRGMTLKELEKAARGLGFATRRRLKYDVDDDTGILSVMVPGDHSTEHCVYLWEGRVVEPMSDRRQLWLSATAFLSHYGYKAGTLLALEKD